MKKTIPIIIPLLLLMFTAAPLARNQEKKTSPGGIVVGVGAIAGGTFLSVYNYTRARAQYEVYQQSAFTDNTRELHREMRKRDILTVVGAAAAGLGLICIVVSF